MRVQTGNSRRSFAHVLPPGARLSGVLLIVLATALMPRRPHLAYLVPAGVLLILWAVSRMPVLPALRRMFVAEFFILGIALLSLLNPAALPVFLATVIKSNICVLAMLILAWTTPFHELLGQLRRAGLPPVMITTIALLQRYLPVLVEESRRMQRARTSRTFSRKGRFAFDWRNLSVIAGQLFVRSADRAERIYLAMCARGWK